jgi:hypothetical protein
MAFGDFADRMLSTKRLKQSFSNPFKALDVKNTVKRSAEDVETLFAGAPEQPTAPESIGKTLQAQDDQSLMSEPKRLKAATIAGGQPLGKKRTNLGG